MRHSQSFRTSNVILKELNERYFVTYPIDEKANTTKRFFINDAPDSGGLYFMFEVTAEPSSKKCVFFNGKKFTSVDILLREADEFNKTRLFPPEFYDPSNRYSYNQFESVGWYLTHLGFELKKGYLVGPDVNTYELKDVYGNVLTTLSISRQTEYDDENNFKGFIIKFLPNDSFVRNEFSSREEAVSIINSLVGAETAVNIKKMTDILDRMKGGFDALDNADIYRKDSFLTDFTEPLKIKLVPQLEELLSSLKKETVSLKTTVLTQPDTKQHPIENKSCWHMSGNPPKDGKQHECLIQMTEHGQKYNYLCQWIWNKQQKGWFKDGQPFDKTETYNFKWIELSEIK